MSLPALVADLLEPGDLDSLVFPDSAGGYMRGSNVRRRWWSQAVAAAQLFPRAVTDAAGKKAVVYDFKLHELRHTASLAIQAGANIKALQTMLGHESAGLTVDCYGHLYGSDVEALGVAINQLLTRNCGQNVGINGNSGPQLQVLDKRLSCAFYLWSLGCLSSRHRSQLSRDIVHTRRRGLSDGNAAAGGHGRAGRRAE